MQKIALIGAGGHGKVVADIVAARGDTLFFYDECYPMRLVNGQHTIAGTFDDYCKNANDGFRAVVTVGDNKTRADIQGKCSFLAAPLIHPSAIVSPSARLGEGTVVMPGAVINADADIGCGVIINTGAVIEHDCKIGSFVHISPQVALAGNVTIEAFAWIGLGSNIKQLVTVGEGAIIGAGSAVVSDVGPRLTAFGNPCRPL